MVFLEIAVFVTGALIVLLTLWSSILTVIVPRAERATLSRIHFSVIRKVFAFVASKDKSHSEQIMARYAPVALILLPLMWAFHVVVGFAMMFWALGTRGVIDAIVLSGSSLTTLGFRSSQDTATLVFDILEAGIGLGLVALMISYLPTLYGAFTEREHMVAHLEIRAGRPPRPDVMIPRLYAIGRLTEHDDLWDSWEHWFIDIEETHTTHPSLVFFHSAYPGRSWVTSAGAALDAAAIVISAVDVPPQSSSVIMMRAGFLSLREVAAVFGIEVDRDPAPDDPISVTRAEFDEVVATIAAGGVPIKEDQDQAWKDFAGWRVNYDQALLGLCVLVGASPAPWSSDRIDTTVSVKKIRELERSRRSQRKAKK